MPGSLRSRATTGGSTMPTSRMDATICAYFGVFLIASVTILSGWMSSDRDPKPRLLEAHLHRSTLPALRAMSGLTPAWMRVARLPGSVSSPSARNSVTKFSSANSVAQRLGDEYQAIARGLSLADQKPLAIDVLLIGANERIRRQGPFSALAAQSCGFESFATPLPLLDQPSGRDRACGRAAGSFRRPAGGRPGSRHRQAAAISTAMLTGI